MFVFQKKTHDLCSFSKTEPDLAITKGHGFFFFVKSNKKTTKQNKKNSKMAEEEGAKHSEEALNHIDNTIRERGIPCTRGIMTVECPKISPWPKRGNKKYKFPLSAENLTSEQTQDSQEFHRVSNELKRRLVLELIVDRVKDESKKKAFRMLIAKEFEEMRKMRVCPSKKK